MPRVMYDNITFDSELEVNYYKYLKENKEVIDFYYHLKAKIPITKNNNYTPDFVVVYEDRIEIVETKGYNQFSFMKDNMTHNVMLSKTEKELKEYLLDNNITEEVIGNKKVIYRKVKHIKSIGFVDFDFKNPNTIANKRKNKIEELEKELKEKNEYVKKVNRFLTYYFNIENGKKLTKPQKEWFENTKGDLKNDLCRVEN